MTSDQIFVTVLGLAAAVVVAWFFWFKRFKWNFWVWWFIRNKRKHWFFRLKR